MLHKVEYCCFFQNIVAPVSHPSHIVFLPIIIVVFPFLFYNFTVYIKKNNRIWFAIGSCMKFHFFRGKNYIFSGPELRFLVILTAYSSPCDFWVVFWKWIESLILWFSEQVFVLLWNFTSFEVKKSHFNRPRLQFLVLLYYYSFPCDFWSVFWKWIDLSFYQALVRPLNTC